MNCEKLRQPLSSNPEVSVAQVVNLRRSQNTRPPRAHQLIKQYLPIISQPFFYSNEAKLHQRIMQFVGILSLWPRLCSDALNCRRIQASQVRSSFSVEKTPVHHRERAALFSRSVVEKRVRFCGQNFLGQRRWFVHFAGDELSLDLAAAAPARNRQRARRVPTPANIEHGRVQQRLGQDVTDSFGIEILKNRFQRKAVRRPQRENDRVFGGRGLQLEIESAAETFT